MLEHVELLLSIATGVGLFVYLGYSLIRAEEL